LNALQRGDVLVVAKRDRIARDAFISVLVERAVAKKGARILSAAGEGTETDDPAAVFTRRILDAVSELERALIAARTRAAMREAKQRGQRVGRIPFGHRLAEDGIHLEADPEEQTILREIQHWRRGGYSLAVIAEALNARDLRNRQGREWQRSFISQLLERHALR
jgi:site-specific DNA recombinase